MPSCSGVVIGFPFMYLRSSNPTLELAFVALDEL